MAMGKQLAVLSEKLGVIMTNNPSFKKICVIGLGYVGLPTAAIFASSGLNVLGVDNNPETIEAINSGKINTTEPDLDVLVNKAMVAGKFRVAHLPEPADAFIIAVPTPFTTNQTPDLSYINAVADTLAPVLAADNIVIVESTIPVGSTEHFSRRLASKRKDLTFPLTDDKEPDICIAHSPERVLPGQVLVELTENDRVIGGITSRCAKRAAQLYQNIVNGHCFLTTARTAELVKLAENAYRDVSIAFANELANVSETLSLDPWEVINLANHHPRVNILRPGPGVGGHCIAVDPWFIVSSAPEDTPLIQAARGVNDDRPMRVASKILQIASDLKSPKIACLGLSYKANTNDLRGSASVEVVKLLAANSYAITIVEPYINSLPSQLKALKNIRLGSLEEISDESDIIALLTDHQVFRELDISTFQNQILVDTRGVWNSVK